MVPVTLFVPYQSAAAVAAAAAAAAAAATTRTKPTNRGSYGINCNGHSNALTERSSRWQRERALQTSDIAQVR
jgi:hypothetical protein